MKYLKSQLAIVFYAVAALFFITFSFETGTLKIFPLKNVSAANSFVILGIIVTFQWIKKHWKNDYGKLFYFLIGILSVIFSYITFMGKYFSSDPQTGLSDILVNDGKILQAVVCFGGGCIFFLFAFLGIGSLKVWNSTLKDNSQSFMYNVSKYLFGKNCFFKQCIVLGICWLPHVIVRYPGAVVIDSFVSLSQYYGKARFTTQHPILYTYILGRFTDWGVKLGNADYGLFALILMQTIAMVLILAYCINTMRKFKISYWICLMSMVVFCTIPSIIAFTTTAIIDAPYGAAFVLLMIELVYYLYAPQIYRKSWKHLSLTALAVLGTFFRYNGFYIVVIIFVLLVFRELYLWVKRKQKIIYSVLVLLAILIPIVTGKTIVSNLNSESNAIYVSERAKFAMPIQQIARYMVYYGDEDVTPEEMKTIQKVMNWSVEEYREHYNPYNFDSLKGGFNNNATSQEKKEFLKVWLSLFFRHPKVYLDASLNQNYFLFSPFEDNYRYYRDSQKYAKRKKYDFSKLYVGNSNDEFWTDLQEKINNYYGDFHRIPFLGFWVNQGWHSLLLLGICIYALMQKNGKQLFLSLPLLLTLGVAFIGPTMRYNPRYTFPIMYSMPLFLGIFICGKNVQIQSKNDYVEKRE